MHDASLYEKLFRQALLIRLFEEKVIELYPSDRIQSPVHLSIGQEAVAVGVCHALQRDDLLFGNYRGHAFYIAKGGDLKQMMAELFGKATGCGRGKAGSMHLAAPEVNFMGSSAVVASTIPHAVGAAWAAKHRGTGQIAVAVFGDGATEQGVYHESLNFAAIRDVPVLFLCENNGLAIHTHTEKHHAYDIVGHAAAYGIESEQIDDGHDFMGIARRIGELVAAMRVDRKPRFVEIITCRYKEHVGPGDDWHVGYRSKEVLAAWQARDPLIQNAELVRRLTPELQREIAAAVEFAEASPWPDRGELLQHVI